MSTFVLVPGFWLGGWAWDGVAVPLRAAGHDVHAVTLTGLGDLAHLGTPATNVDTHVEDIVAMITGRDLCDVVLVAHSGGGVAATGAAGRVAGRIASIVYLDSGPLADGVAQLDLYPPEGRAYVEAHLTDGWRYEPPTWEEQETLGASTLGLTERDKAAIAARMTPQPYGTLTQAARGAEEAAKLPKTLVACSFSLEDVRGLIEGGHPMFAALTGPEWTFLELPTGHWPMFSRPEDVAALLDSFTK
ncbi:alpha/beta hydrolase [Sphaerisporangium sp. TRM90804]|uniref:alpha/beta fold hydrolase n=1 Tax=Sphaerisporangium sp. TRM90804 TaxID=3031113 RepID=UPI002447280F|nr:alpha/beta hydrolase [Sphaerisporangium sp. TRM90804]MDH2426195.1 alpha/beta hydrolase [Sphaerisporangium sp. TRM90804]